VTASPVPGDCSTKLSANAPAGSTTIQVDNAAGCAAGECVTIGGIETVCIASVSGNVITLTSPTTTSHSAGESVAAAAATPGPGGLPAGGGPLGGDGNGTPWLMLLGVAGLIAAATAYRRSRARREEQ
jgi:hypothetical protein